jgi:hypothetical protein
MISKCLTPEIEKIRGILGISKSDYATMALAFLTVWLAPLEKTPRKRQQLLTEVSREFQKVVEEAAQRV